MDSLTIKLPRLLHRQLQDKARKTGRSKSELARESIERLVKQDDEPSCHDLMKEACGHYAGPRNSSSKEGFDD